MKKLIALSLIGLSIAGSASALTNTGTAWSCSPNANQGATAGLQYCTAAITSATTTAQLGKFIIVPSKQITVIGGVSGSAVANVVTPTINLFLGNKQIASQSVSVSTVGNVVTLGVNGVSYFDGFTVSQSVPSLISSTNALTIGVTENTRIQSVQ